ncbi:hypothetical protein A0J61_02909 [Choanephora cucurbitarum]|uniref:Uncharacterized protein n=1 Tax=Choanephora cucurbitarum TaxID=101091 RepID=A0A1C7NIU8_9FUNG|nr:hypothetical protein A0J61_02909 [Choanephora cucurbitarum]
MSVIFSRDLPQSSLKSDDGQSLLCLDKFEILPRTLYDEIGQQDRDFYDPQARSQQEESQNAADWKHVVYRLQVENTSLINSLHETNLNLMQSRREKEELENFIQRQTETTDEIVSRLKLTVKNLLKQNRENEALLAQQKLQSLDLIFQKKYLVLENQALKERSQLDDPIPPLKKWRACVYAIIALQRFLSFSNSN